MDRIKFQRAKDFFKSGSGRFKLNSRLKKIAYGTLLTVVMLFSSLKGQDSRTRELTQNYVSVVKELNSKGNIVKMAEHPEIAEISNALIASLREDVRKFIMKGEFDNALTTLAVINRIGETFKDSTLMENTRAIREEIWVDRKDKVAPIVEQIIMGKENHKSPIQGITINLEGEGWSFSITQNGNVQNISRVVSESTRLAENLSSLPSELEIKESIKKSGLNLTASQIDYLVKLILDSFSKN